MSARQDPFWLPRQNETKEREREEKKKKKRKQEWPFIMRRRRRRLLPPVTHHSLATEAQMFVRGYVWRWLS